MKRAHPSYLILFGIGLAWWIVSELLFLVTLEFPVWYWPAVVLYIGAVELAGARRTKDEIDTASEISWWFQLPEDARRRLTVAVFIALCVRIGSVPFIMRGTIEEWPWLILAYAPLVIIAGGMGAWLVPHIVRFGRDRAKHRSKIRRAAAEAHRTGWDNSSTNRVSFGESATEAIEAADELYGR